MKTVGTLCAFVPGGVAQFAANPPPPLAERWHPLWDGKTFTGWPAIGEEEWSPPPVPASMLMSRNP
jgi:hypothetical protein